MLKVKNIVLVMQDILTLGISYLKDCILSIHHLIFQFPFGCGGLHIVLNLSYFSTSL